MATVGRLRKKAVFCLSLLILALTTPGVAKALNQTKKNVLVIHSYNPELSWTEKEKQGIDDGFQSSRHSVTVYHEFLDAKRYPDLAHHQAFLSYLHEKYQNTDLQLLMVADDPGLNMVLANRDECFKNLPVVFMGINHVQDKLLTIPWLTGVFETHSYEETILEAERQTQSNHILVLIDSTETGDANLKRLRQLQASNDILPEITVVEDVTPATITEIFKQYPRDWPILLRGQLRADDENGALLPFEKTVQVLRSQLENPIYTVSGHELGHGVVGGKVLEGSYHAEQAVQLAEKILDGTPVNQIEPIINAKNQWIFDHKELKHFNISQGNLPANSLLINVEPSFYQQHRQLVWYALSIFSLGALIILLLLDAIRRQKQAEITLEKRVAERTDKLSQTLQELKQTQAQLIQTEKLSSLGQLVGGIAHEFNNPLTFIAGNIEILKDYSKDLLHLGKLYQQQTVVDIPGEAVPNRQDIDLEYIQEDMPKIFQSITKGTERIETIIRSLQSFACSDEQGIKPIDLNNSLDNTLLILQSLIGNDIEIVKDYNKLPLVHCEPGAINQVFMQVLLNAIEAVTPLSKSNLRQIVIHTYTQEANWVTISIQDTGLGIPPSIQERIFDPFFTTKPVGEGAGLGLAVSYQYIQQHNGQLSFQANYPQGSTFIIQLPIESSL
ncbi:MAG: GHKL domain-containing protein [Leptolyngbya sp. SIO3F4]|nr:GHKL domain-containing protein [Leptolyngbya sp. SIO3F4]